MRAVDTHVVVREITRDDERQFVATGDFIATGAWISHVVLAETVWVLAARYGLDHQEIATAIAMLLKHQHFAFEDAQVVAAALLHYGESPALRFTDCLILEIARKAGHLPLGTFGKTLSKLDGTELL